MKKILVAISDKAHENLMRYKFEQGHTKMDDAINEILEMLFEEEEKKE